MITLLTPRYAHPRVGKDERIGRGIADMADDPSENPMPKKCSDCGVSSTFDNPLMMKPFFIRSKDGGPKGTLYQARCARCQERRVRRR